MITKLGADSTNALRAQVGNTIQTDQYGLATAQVDFDYGAADEAEKNRPTPGEICPISDYKGINLFCETAGVVRKIGDTARISVTYLGIDANYPILPKLTSELELRDTGSVASASGLAAGSLPGLSFLPIPHPVLEYNFVAAKVQGKLSTFGTPPNAPTVPNYIWKSPLQAATDGVVSNYNVIATFVPDTRGWFCLKDDATPMCAGKIFTIEQRWKRYLIISSVAIVKL